jgi:hypothetical protein
MKAKAMKRKFGGVGLGYEDQPGAMELGAWGEPMWKQDAGQWLNRRSEDTKVLVRQMAGKKIRYGPNGPGNQAPGRSATMVTRTVSRGRYSTKFQSTCKNPLFAEGRTLTI